MSKTSTVSNVVRQRVKTVKFTGEFYEYGYIECHPRDRQKDTFVCEGVADTYEDAMDKCFGEKSLSVYEPDTDLAKLHRDFGNKRR